MNPQMWKELKGWVCKWPDSIITVNELKQKMEELERRSLPERVAEILENLNPDKIYSLPANYYEYTLVRKITRAFARALKTGDTSEIERWAEKDHA